MTLAKKRKNAIFAARMKGSRKISAVALLALYAIFFASTNLCIHSHDIGGVHVVHSHLGGGASHSHTASQIQTITVFNTEAFVSSQCISAGDLCFAATVENCSIAYQDAILPANYKTHSLRAPPYFA